VFEIPYLYEYKKEELDDAISNGVCWVCDTSIGDAECVDDFNCCSAVLDQYGCNGCGGSFDPDYGGEIEEETGRLNMCGSCLDKGVTA